MEHVTAPDGTRIGYDCSGDGSPIVLVHGTTADHTAWDRVRRYLEPNFTVHAMDRRGRGESGDGDEYDIHREFEDVVAVVEDIGGTVDVVGHSYGAVCALGASRLTEAIGRMVLYEPPLWTPGATLAPPEPLDRMAEQLAAEEYEGVLETFFRDVTMSEERLELYRSEPGWDERFAMAPTIPREVRMTDAYRPDPATFEDVTIPTRLLLGSETEGPLVAGTEATHDYLPNSELVMLPDQGHGATFDGPDVLANAIEDFLVTSD